MTENNSNGPWKDLLATARKAAATGEQDPPDSAPPDFVSRVREMRAGLWAFAKAIFWRRWSLVAVGVALLVYLLVYLLLKDPPPRTIPAPAPPQLQTP